MSPAEQKAALLLLLDDAVLDAEARVFKIVRDEKEMHARIELLRTLDCMHLAARELRVAIDRIERF